MFGVDEPPVGWVGEVPADPGEVPPDLADGEGSGLDPDDEVAFIVESEERARLAVNRHVDDLDAEGVLAAVVAAQTTVNLAQARQLFLAAHWADLHAVVDRPALSGRGGEQLIRPGGAGTPALSEFAPAELGAVLGLSVVSAKLLIADALDLRHRLPRLWHRLQTGTIKLWVVRRIASRTRHLTQQAAGRVDGRLCQIAGRVVGGRLEKILDAAILAADPAQGDADAHAAADRHGVWLSADTDHGHGTLVAKGPIPDLRAVDVSLDELAAALTILGDTDTHDARRVKALTLLADPEAALDTIRRANHTVADHDDHDDDTPAGPQHDTGPARRPCTLGRAVLYVHLADHTLTGARTGVPGGIARVHDVGPVVLGQVATWLRHRDVTVTPVLNIPGITAVDRYEFTPTMADALRIISPADYFPYSTNLTGHGDNEHPQPYIPTDNGGPPGQTGLHNGAWTPRHPHRIKTHSGWKVTQLRPGAWLWRTPHAHHFLVDEHGTTPLGALT